jgi:adenosine deaminase
MLTRSLITAWLVCASAVGLTRGAEQGRAATANGAESAMARRFDALKGDPIRLRAFLYAMPKGGDLHNHLSGAVYAERYLEWAAEDGNCLVTATMTIVEGPCSDAGGRPPASAVLQNLELFDRAVDAMSMRHWNPTLNGHDHFFAAFGKFGPPSDRTGDMLADVASRAAAEQVSYLELMLTPDGAAGAIGRTVPVRTDLAAWRDALLAAALRERAVAAARQRLDAAEARWREVLRCGTPTADAGCGVTIRYIAQVGRARGPEQAYAQMVAWFELVSADPRVVSINLVQPEDDPFAVRDFALHMSMLDYLHGVYPTVRVTLHAGELSDTLVPPAALRSHVRDSIRRGHAQRVGHGTAAVLEDDPFGLLREMAEKKVLVEVALSSADQILGVRGRDHPLRHFLESGVPVALVTDDAGVSRSSHTHEFVKAVQEHNLDYPTLKRLARNSIAFSFADAATRARLTTQLEAAYTEFERRPPS